MNRAALRDLVNATRLPPALRIELVDDQFDPHSAPLVRITGHWTDSDGSGGKAVTATMLQPMLLEIADEDHARDLIYGAARSLWMHELHEWVTFRGEHHHEPHNADGSFRS